MLQEWEPVGIIVSGTGCSADDCDILRREHVVKIGRVYSNTRRTAWSAVFPLDNLNSSQNGLELLRLLSCGSIRHHICLLAISQHYLRFLFAPPCIIGICET